ncbi:MAG: hypothetical protein IPN97_12315 [Saprospiraceae bacterium]|nr:hypothetical protein [Saprospiraceae bacterium]
MHLNLGITPTQIESAGMTLASVLDDIDGNVRPGPAGSVNGGALLYDMGADEFDGVHLDLTPPTISYSPLNFTCAIGNRTLTATISDLFSGVPTSGGGLPVLYWRINAGPYNAATGTHVSGSTYSFTFGVGVGVGDVVSYYIVAQDGAGTANVGSFPSLGASGFTANPPLASTPPTTPSSYPIATTLPFGTYTVGGAGTYPTLTAAINEYNTKCLNGPIIFELLDALHTEAGAMTIIKHPDASATNTLTIRPATGVTASVTATVASGPLLKILGNYVTIDGSKNGSNSRDLTLANASTTTPTVVHIGSTGTIPITNVTLKNCIVINGVSTSTAIVTSDGAVLGTAGYFNDITIQNNDIQRALNGCFNIAVVSPGNGSGLLLTQNTLNTTDGSAIRRNGLYLQGVSGATVSNNTIGNFSNIDGENDHGIWLATGTSNTTVIGNTVSNLGMTLTSAFAPYGIRESSGLAASGNIISGNTIDNISTAGTTNNLSGIDNSSSGTIIERNNVSNINNLNTGTFGAYGINISAGSNVIIRNNFVSNVNQVMTTGNAFSASFGVFGIRIASGINHVVYHNSVNLNGLLPGTASSSLLSAAFCLVSNGSTGCDVRNNIFANNITGGTTNIAHVAIYLPSGGTSANNLNLDNNVYFHGTDIARQGVCHDFINFYTTIAGLRAYTTTLSTSNTNDLNSDAYNAAVPFISTTDLHINPSFGFYVNSAGAPLASVTTDIDGIDVRDSSNPDAGADEISLSCSAVVTNSGNDIITVGTLRNVLSCVSDGSIITFDPGVPTSFFTEPLTIKKNITLQGVAALDFDFSNAALSSSTFGLRIGVGKTVTLHNIDIIDKNNPNSTPPSLVPIILVQTGMPGGTLINTGATTISKL